MNQLINALLLLGLGVGAAVGQVVDRAEKALVPDSERKEWQPTKRTAHETVWISVTALTNPATGSVHHRTNSFTALATGLNYQKDGQWVESREEIELF
jgi:hypothetical protein